MQSRRLLQSPIFVIILFLGGIAVLFSNLYYCGFIGDEPYMTLCVRDYPNCPLGLLTFAIGHAWCSLFGLSFLSLRVLAHLCYLTAIGGACIYLYKTTRNRLLTATVFLVSCFLAVLGSESIYDWNTAAYPFEVFVVLSLFAYVSHPSRIKIASVGIACGFLTAARLTMAPIACLALFLIIACRKNRQDSLKDMLTDSLVGLLSMLLTIAIVWLAICGSAQGVVAAFSPDNIITGHGLDSIGKYIYSFKMIFPVTCLSWVLGFLCYYLAYITRNKKLTSFSFISSVLLAIIVGWSIMRMTVMTSSYDNFIFGISFPYVIIPALILPFFVFHCQIGEIWKSDITLKSIAILCMLFLMGFGSDVFPTRWHGSFLFPMAIAVISPMIDADEIKTIFRWLFISIISFCFIGIYKYCAIKKHYTYRSEPLSYFGDVPIMSEFDSFINGIEPEIKRLESENQRFTFWGAYHLHLSLAYEKEKAFSIHNFHTQRDILEVLYNPDDIDYIFITIVNNDTEPMQESIQSLERNGFTPVKRTDTFILYKNERNEDKK